MSIEVANNVTIKISPITKAMMDMTASKLLVDKRKSLTNDEVIAELIKIADPETYAQITERERQRVNKGDAK